MAAKTPSAIGRPPKRHVATLRPTDTVLDELLADLDVSAGEKLRRVDPTLANTFDAIDKRLRAEQDKETVKQAPVDLDGAAWVLAEERTALLLAGGKLIDAGLDLAGFAVRVQQRAAGIEAAAHMAMATIEPTQPPAPQAALPPPPDDDDTGNEGVPLVWPDDDDDDDTENLRVIRKDALGNLTRQNEELGLYGTDPAGWPVDPDLDPDTDPWAPSLAVRVGCWWQRTRQHAKHTYARVAVGVLITAGLSWGIG